MKRIDGKEGRKYHTMQQLGEDIELVFAKYVFLPALLHTSLSTLIAILLLTYASCRQFNPPGEITALADACESVYRREWPKAINPRMTSDERKAMSSLINKALKDPISFIFREAVDPVLFNIPNYFDVYVHLFYSQSLLSSSMSFTLHLRSLLVGSGEVDQQS